MQKQMKSLIIALTCMTMPVMAQKTDLVNPIIGTNGMGHTFPGACAPFGIVQVSPDTDTIPHNINGVYQPRVYEYCAGYQHKDSSIVGFSHTHFSGTGHSDLGDILLMPFTGKLQIRPPPFFSRRTIIRTAAIVPDSAMIPKYPVRATTKCYWLTTRSKCN